MAKTLEATMAIVTGSGIGVVSFSRAEVVENVTCPGELEEREICPRQNAVQQSNMTTIMIQDFVPNILLSPAFSAFRHF